MLYILTNEYSLLVYRWIACGWYQRAKRVARAVEKAYNIEFTFHEADSRDEYHAERAQLINTIPGAENHRTSPLVWHTLPSGTNQYVGGASEFVAFATQHFPDANFRHD